VTATGLARTLVQLDRSILTHTTRWWCQGCGAVRDQWAAGEKEYATDLFRAVEKHPEVREILGSEFRTRNTETTDERSDEGGTQGEGRAEGGGPGG
jgi:hypothetical protein